MSSNLSKFDPFGEVTRFEPFNSLENFFRDFRLKSAFESESHMRMDVAETDQAYTVKAEIPGARKEDIKVDVDRNQISIDVEMKKESEEKEGKRVVRSERYFGRQYRSFAVPHEIDEDKVEAAYHNGVLELTLPKKAGHNGRKIAVK